MVSGICRSNTPSGWFCQQDCRHFVDSYVVETDKKAVSSFYDRGYIAERLKGLETELALECRITLNGEERWVRNVIIRGEIEDSEYAMIFLRDITEAKVESARHLQMAADNASMEQLIQSIVRLVDRFVVCDLENDRYEFYNLNGHIAKPLDMNKLNDVLENWL